MTRYTGTDAQRYLEDRARSYRLFKKADAPMTEHDAMAAAQSRILPAPAPHADEIVAAAIERRMAELHGVDVDSEAWWPLMDRQRDAEDDYLRHQGGGAA